MDIIDRTKEVNMEQTILHQMEDSLVEVVVDLIVDLVVVEVEMVL